MNEKFFTFGSDGKRKRTKAGYDAMFESLMRYTSFKSVSQIKSREDLRQFFSEVKGDAESRGREFHVSNKMRFEAENVVIRLGDSKKVIKSVKDEVVEGKAYRRFQDAKSRGLVVPNTDNKLVFKAYITKKGKTRTVYRDEKGRFAKGL